MSHFTKECEFGKSHGTCRCMSKDKTIIKVPCDRPNYHKPKEESPVLDMNKPWAEIIDEFLEEPEPDTLRERLEKTVESYFGHIVMPIVRESLLDKLENDVKEWLVESAKHSLFKE